MNESGSLHMKRRLAAGVYPMCLVEDSEVDHIHNKQYLRKVITAGCVGGRKNLG